VPEETSGKTKNEKRGAAAPIKKDGGRRQNIVSFGGKGETKEAPRIKIYKTTIQIVVPYLTSMGAGKT